jgi:hypothetical protein
MNDSEDKATFKILANFQKEINDIHDDMNLIFKSLDEFKKHIYLQTEENKATFARSEQMNLKIENIISALKPGKVP